MLYSVIVFRREPGDETDGPHIHGHTGLEIMWTAVPLLAVVVFSVWGAQMLYDITRDDDVEMTVSVIGRKWSWVFEYPDYPDLGPSQVLVLPVNTAIMMQMESPDVIHSFWVPEFRVKQDLVPGMTTYLRVTPTEIGTYRLICAEICGTLHAEMVAEVRVLSQADFDNWIEEQSVSLAALSPEERGELWAAEYACTACHSVTGMDGVGPTWQGLMGLERNFTDGTSVIADEEYIRAMILNPNDRYVVGYAQGVMPANFGDQFEARQAQILANEGAEIDIVDDLIAYIKSLD
jgi:cytochrome c oxidase subunit 2